MTYRRFAPGLGIIAGLALVLSGCSGDSSDGSPTSKDDYVPGPMDEYYKIAYGDWESKSDEEMQAESNAQNQLVEEYIASCMMDQGFEYTPQDYSSISFSLSGEEDGPQYGTLEFAKIYGYGAIDWPGREEQMATQEADSDEWVDPNQDYIESMSESEREAYMLALDGPQPDWESMSEDEMATYQQGGCRGDAYAKVYPNMNNGGEDDPYADLTEQMNSMWETMQTDPRYVAIDAEWASCMADAGYSSFKTPNDAQQSIYDKLNEAWSSGPDGQADASLVDPETGELNADFKKEIKAEEIATATADFTCQDKVNYSKMQQQVRISLEQDFVDTHKDELKAWAQHMAQQREELKANLSEAATPTSES